MVPSTQKPDAHTFLGKTELLWLSFSTFAQTKPPSHVAESHPPPTSNTMYPIINIGDHVLGNLWLKNMCYIIVENGDCVSPTHQEFGEMECAIWCLKGGVVVRCFSECTFVIADIQIKHSSAGTICELLSNLFGEWSV